MRCISLTCCAWPTDTLCGNEYKYILSEIDIASRYKVTRPMRMKKVKDITDMIGNIYKVGPLTCPRVLQCDNSSESKAGVTKLLEKCGVMI